jgi:hypothetical protein
MKEVTVKIKGIAPLGFSAPIQSEKEDKETHGAFEERTWREKMHTTKKGEVYLSPMSLKNALANIAQYRSDKIPGKRNATFTKHFKAGIFIPEPMMLGVQAEDVEPVRVFVPSDGKTGGGSRVWKMFPVLPEWKTEARIVLVDELLEAHIEKVEEYLRLAGQLVGLGWFRPERNGYYGRYEVVEFEAE